jgi:hypothetical protein
MEASPKAKPEIFPISSTHGRNILWGLTAWEIYFSGSTGIEIIPNFADWVSTFFNKTLSSAFVA